MKPDSITSSDIFDCKQCGDCCSGYGGTYVTEKDISAISKYIGEDPDTFTEKYCRISGKKPLLATGDDGKCIFFDKLCTIHPVKPRMCRAWPFIEGVLKEPGNWKIMAEACPGIRTDVPMEAVQCCVREEIAKLNAQRAHLD